MCRGEPGGLKKRKQEALSGGGGLGGEPGSLSVHTQICQRSKCSGVLAPVAPAVRVLVGRQGCGGRGRGGGIPGEGTCRGASCGTTVRRKAGRVSGGQEALEAVSCSGQEDQLGRKEGGGTEARGRSGRCRDTATSCAHRPDECQNVQKLRWMHK